MARGVFSTWDSSPLSRAANPQPGRQITAAEAIHCRAILEANERRIRGNWTPDDRAFLNQIRANHGFGAI